MAGGGRPGGPGRPLGLVAAEALYAAAPALLVILTLGAVGEIGVLAAGFSALLASVSAVSLARWRIADAERLRSWIARILAGADAGPAPAIAGPLGEFVQPVAELARRLAQRDETIDAQARRLDTIVDALPDPILVVDRRLVVRQSNPAADRTFGVALVGLPLGRAVRDPGVLAAVGAAQRSGVASSVAFSPAADRVKHFAARIAPIDVGAGESGVLLALREQTEQVIIERMRSDFVANASHEIRTPLASIIGVTETLRGPARDDPGARAMFLDMLAAEAERLQRLVDDLLSLSRVELAANRPPESEVDVAEAVRDVVGRMGPLAERAGVALQVVVEPGLPPVRADMDQLQQLLGNLVDNAIKYGGAGKRVKIEAGCLPRAPGDAGPVAGRPCVAVRVIDQGEGIAAEHLPRITERFYRIDKARSRRIGGTGLGLAIVKHIVRRHQGHLLIESELGRGSRFSVFLPIAVTDPALSSSCHQAVTDLVA